MTHNLLEEIGLVSNMFQNLEYNVMVSIPDLKSYFLSNMASSQKAESDPNKQLERKPTRDSKKSAGEVSTIAAMRFNAMLRQPTNRSAQSGMPERAGNSMADLNLDATGYDSENRIFGSYFKLPLNIQKVIEEFGNSMANQKQIRASPSINPDDPQLMRGSSSRSGEKIDSPEHPAKRASRGGPLLNLMGVPPSGQMEPMKSLPMSSARTIISVNSAAPPKKDTIVGAPNLTALFSGLGGSINKKELEQVDHPADVVPNNGECAQLSPQVDRE